MGTIRAQLTKTMDREHAVELMLWVLAKAGVSDPHTVYLGVTGRWVQAEIEIESDLGKVNAIHLTLAKMGYTVELDGEDNFLYLRVKL